MSKHVLGVMRFKTWLCKAVLETYSNGRPAIALFDSENGSPIACATVNVPEVPLSSDEIIVKDYSENTGMLEALVAAGIVNVTDKTVPIGFAVGHVCKLASVDVPVAL
jgi:hypothetical protein